jgi:hypothetical protein
VPWPRAPAVRPDVRIPAAPAGRGEDVRRHPCNIPQKVSGIQDGAIRRRAHPAAEFAPI